MKKNYITKKTFEKIKDEKFNLLIGANLITITNIQLNFHKINSPTYPHYHPDAQLLYYLKGSGIEEIDGKKFNIVPGSFVFIPSYKKHAFFPYKETTAEIFTMRFEAKKNIIKKLML
ncbi:MAG TPA: cupin domain-containing protein [bacterium]|nr:cupin domain-containing protein [bacterium]